MIKCQYAEVGCRKYHMTLLVDILAIILVDRVNRYHAVKDSPRQRRAAQAQLSIRPIVHSDPTNVAAVSDVVQS